MALPSSQTTREWAVFTLVVGSRVYRAMLLTLVAIAFAPLLIGWQSFVIKSGSMEPTIDVGDVALGRAFADDEEIAVGRVYMFDDPAADKERILVHRVVELRDDHTYTTAGDANAVTDFTPVTPDDMTARAILLVPFVGLPIIWLQTGQFVLLGIWLALTTAAFYLATRHIDGEPPRWTLRRLLRERLQRTPRAGRDAGADARDDERVLVRATGPRTRGIRARGIQALGATLALCLLGTALGTANATFTTTSRNPGNHFKASVGPLPYNGAVLTDNPRGFWLLDETTGSNVRDYSRTYSDGSTRNGTVERGLPGAHTPRNPGTSFRFDGGGALLTPSSMRVGGTHSVELWFRTTSTQEGYLIGFESQSPLALADYDRTVHMNDGRIAVGNWSLVNRNVVTTPLRYNDGEWHHLVVTMAPNGSRPRAIIYVDGAQVAAGDTTPVNTNYEGHWQIGEGRRAAGTILWPFPVTLDFRGDIDAVAVYPQALTAARVRAHWDAR